MLLAIEGIDGSGKNTLARNLQRLLSPRRAGIVSSPGYDRTQAGRLIGLHLSGALSFGQDNPIALAMLFALDRQEGQPDLHRRIQAGEIIIADRYVASNAAYQAARATIPAAVRDWVLDAEYQRLSCLVPDLNVFLDMPVPMARDTIRAKGARDYIGSGPDRYEADHALLERVRQQYLALSTSAQFGPWLKIDVASDGALRTPEAIAEEVAGHVRRLF